MTADIVDRLRRKANHFADRTAAPDLYRLLIEAANEIEALRSAIRIEIKRGTR